MVGTTGSSRWHGGIRPTCCSVRVESLGRLARAGRLAADGTAAAPLFLVLRSGDIRLAGRSGQPAGWNCAGAGTA